MIRTILCSAALALIATGALAEDSATDKAAEISKNVRLVYDQPLPNVPDKSMRGVVVEYEPGGNSPAHLHPKSAFIYATVLEGAIKSKVNDGPEVTYRAGESWSEFPGDRHAVSANASATERARLLAVFVVDTDETELVIPFDE
ncbi:MAG: cupin domain-containing protein [Mesorhizobium sp.]|uniref:cupin domain-containing protein n=1 Tax=unclassified Mesorhizobium TaxID=325217 RepID=UPI000FCAAAF4|nr:MULTISPECIES: cupin domain-containing protein [unclassified Mesorhizobium]RUV73385.1 cupin domain-containing protein [Mesorhizobium sp. M5C.F.Cr.IN.023.01.1.1]RWF87282.1 MAG: cupin domain-containing protein [Mesorhizobium sp.]RWF92384.1 MAG: cupin domain-containing protein [Mesorhizobium sp.]RWI43380.1 MAG: cupin domain-containing protein [Mesorhizobium sp.]RWI47710.1 MAG: cupin domain-containing protein [Mesorhizobium sp.]